LKLLHLFLSAIFSPWQFFKESVLSPCIEFALIEPNDLNSISWQPYGIRPESLSFFDFFRSIFFNPIANEILYTLDCAERLILDFSEDDESEIFQRIKNDIQRKGINTSDGSKLQFRIVLINKDGNQETVFISKLEKINL
jgi:hypothetical protein